MYTETVTPANETVLPEKPSVKDLDSVLAEIAENTRIQAKNSKKQLIWLRVCAIEDGTQAADREEIMSLADVYIRDYSELM